MKTKTPSPSTTGTPDTPGSRNTCHRTSVTLYVQIQIFVAPERQRPLPKDQVPSERFRTHGSLLHGKYLRFFL